MLRKSFAIPIYDDEECQRAVWMEFDSRVPLPIARGTARGSLRRQHEALMKFVLIPRNLHSFAIAT